MDYLLSGEHPISGEYPAGKDCRYGETFESLQAEIEKMSSPTATGRIDWSIVVDLSSVILLEQSKDLIVAGYMAVGLIHTRRIEGLEEGIIVLKDLVENFWETLYPSKKRMPGRVGAILWWLEKAENELLNLKSHTISAVQSQRIQANVKELDQQLAGKMSEPPSFNILLRRLRNIPIKKTKVPEAPLDKPNGRPAAEPPPSKPTIQAPSPDDKPAHTIQTMESERDADHNVDLAIQLLRKTSHFLIQQDLKNPLAYRYRRMASWARIESKPPNTEGMTHLLPPSPQSISALRDLQDNDNWPALVQTAEQKISQFVFWMDLHFMVAGGLKNLGKAYQEALDTVIQECAGFLHRLPGIETLCFADGTPFAAPHTLQWLEEIDAAPNGNGQDSKRSQSNNRDTFNTIVNQALSMARRKQLEPAVALLQEQMLVSTAGSTKMTWRMAIVRVLSAVKKYELVVPHLETIMSEIDKFNLEQWDPPLALQGLTAVWKGFQAQTTKELKLRSDKILSRIARIDPTAAIRMVQNSTRL